MYTVMYLISCFSQEDMEELKMLKIHGKENEILKATVVSGKGSSPLHIK